MKRTAITLALILAGVQFFFAQETKSTGLTLQQCVQLAVENNINVKATRIDMDKSGYKEEEFLFIPDCQPVDSHLRWFGKTREIMLGQARIPEVCGSMFASGIAIVCYRDNCYFLCAATVNVLVNVWLEPPWCATTV